MWAHSAWPHFTAVGEKERSGVWDNPVQYGYEHEWFDATPVGCPDRWGDQTSLPISSHRCLKASVWQVSGHQHNYSTSPYPQQGLIPFPLSHSLRGVTHQFYKQLYLNIIRDIDVSSYSAWPHFTAEGEKERSGFWDNPVQYGNEHEWFDATPVGCPDRWGDRRLLRISSHRCSEAFVWQVSGHPNTYSTSPYSPQRQIPFPSSYSLRRGHRSILQAALHQHHQGYWCELIAHDLISQLRERKGEVEFGTTLCSMGMSMNGLMLE